jgi:NitT/TauT family transport system substrate-binding protein
MGCCEATNVDLSGVVGPEGYTLGPLDRRTALKGMLGIAGVIAVSSGSPVALAADATKLKLAFCGQLLCVVPYEVTRARGHFAEQGLDVELVYTRGGSQAVQALVGGAVDYAGSSFDAALSAFAKGAQIKRFVSTGRLPLFALAVAPKNKGSITTIKALQGKTVGVSGLGNGDHALMLYLLQHEGVNPKSVNFATLGTNILETVRLGQVDAAMVQEPALTLIVEAGGVDLFNAMDLQQANRMLGGAYEFMGVAVRAEERDRRLPEMKKLAAALKKGLDDTQVISPDEIIASLPKALLAGSDTDQLKQIISRYRASLYPEAVTLDVASAERVLKAQEVANILKPGEVDLAKLLDRAALGG